MKTKRIFLDLESTGTEKIIHGVHQIAGVVEIDGEVVEEFDFKVCPFSHRAIDHDALEISGVAWETIAMYPKPLDVFPDIEETFEEYFDKWHPNKKFTLFTYGESFDLDFLQAFFLHNDSRQLSLLQDWKPVNILGIVRLLVAWGDKKLGRLSNHTLSTLCHFFDIPLDAHDALSDANASRILYHKLTERTTQLLKERA